MAKKEAELDFDEFVASIENWDGEHPPFDEVMRSALLQAALLLRGEAFVRALQAKVGCMATTIPRYAAGTARPLPGVMRLVVAESRTLLIELREQVRKDHAAAVLRMRAVGGSGPDTDE